MQENMIDPLFEEAKNVAAQIFFDVATNMELEQIERCMSDIKASYEESENPVAIEMAQAIFSAMSESSIFFDIEDEKAE